MSTPGQNSNITSWYALGVVPQTSINIHLHMRSELLCRERQQSVHLWQLSKILPPKQRFLPQSLANVSVALLRER